MPKESSEKRLQRIRKEYEEYYDVASINSPNDKNNLESLIRNAAIIAAMQDELDTLVTESAVDNVQTIGKLNTAVSSLMEKNIQLEKSLGIDRKSRRSETSKDNPADYIMELKRSAREFLEPRLIKMYCPECQVLVMRFLPAHDHTAFNFDVQCSQCKKRVTAIRKEKDIFYDLKKNDKAWREKYPIEIVQPKKTIVVDVEDDVILGEEEHNEEDE